MDVSPLGITTSILPHLPTILLTLLLAIFRLSPNATVQSLFTELFVTCVRPILGRPASLRRSQEQLGKDWAVWGNVWIARWTVRRGGDDDEEEGGVCVREAVRRAVLFLYRERIGDDDDGLMELDLDLDLQMPETVDVEVEWVGYRRDAMPFSMRPSGSEGKQYELMMREVERGAPTVLYLHGGAHCLGNPAQFRLPLSWQAKRTKGRYLSVGYRLSPQSMFPAALMDAFMAYLSLIAPPPGVFHDPIPAEEIVLAGDSSGGGLAASLMLLLLTLPRIGIKQVWFNGRQVAIPSPPAAGLALNSPWLDISRALPSVHRNARYDIIAPPSLEPYLGGGTPDFPHDSIWPATPPRVETYCVAKLVTNPLVSPLAASKEMWEGCPPVYACIGWEFGQDETEVTMRRMHEASATVIFEGYVGMPHCFSILLYNRAARIAFDNMAAFCKNAVSGQTKMNASATWMNKSGSTQHIKFDQLGLVPARWDPTEKAVMDDAIIAKLLAKSKDWRVVMERKLLEEWRAAQCSFKAG